MTERQYLKLQRLRLIHEEFVEILNVHRKEWKKIKQGFEEKKKEKNKIHRDRGGCAQASACLPKGSATPRRGRVVWDSDGEGGGVEYFSAQSSENDEEAS